MSPHTQARSAYASASSPIRTGRDTEYAIFARVTGALGAVDEADRRAFPQLARAVADNQRLWGVLAEDLMNDDNQLPVPLRASLISLAEFVRRHSMAVLGGRASIAPLIDINTMIMKGLRGQPEAAA
ncbi:MAG TPA: flagellar biosynthesis regulator FlaF [Amaricoccus sp.]|jgi:flagellar protein FlaF|nr:flagellar biosynthesis regulator FlaF [Amaricoccus sp.]